MCHEDLCVRECVFLTWMCVYSRREAEQYQSRQLESEKYDLTAKFGLASVEKNKLSYAQEKAIDMHDRWVPLFVLPLLK